MKETLAVIQQQVCPHFLHTSYHTSYQPYQWLFRMHFQSFPVMHFHFQSSGQSCVLNIDLVTSAHDPWPVMLTPCTGGWGMGFLYISTGRLHWLPARHLLWEMKPRRMPLLGVFWAHPTTRPGFSPAFEKALSGPGKPISLIIYWKNIPFPCPVITLISIAEK